MMNSVRSGQIKTKVFFNLKVTNQFHLVGNSNSQSQDLCRRLA
jgi:hypothetical protein